MWLDQQEFSPLLSASGRRRGRFCRIGGKMRQIAA